MRFNELPWRGTSSGPRPRAPHPTSEKKRQKEGRGRLDSPRIKPPPASQHLLFPPNLHRLPTARQFPPYTSSHQHTHNKETRFTNYWLTKANDATMKYKTNIKDYLDLEGSISHSFFFFISLSLRPLSHHFALYSWVGRTFLSSLHRYFGRIVCVGDLSLRHLWRVTLKLCEIICNRIDRKWISNDFVPPIRESSAHLCVM